MSIEKVKIVKFLPTQVWIESDMFGGKHVMRKHEGMEPFCYCSFFYDYTHTSNGQIHREAIAMALSLGAEEPVEERARSLQFPSLEEMKSEVAALQEAIKDAEEGDTP